jgi:hypothetical protein
MPPPRGNASGSIYIGLLRSRQLIWSEDEWQWSFKGQTWQGGAARPRAHATFARLGPCGPLVCLFISSCFSGKNIDAIKSPPNLSSGRSLKRQNTQNRHFLLCGVITKIRGSMENPHKSIQNMMITWYNILICWNMHP